MFQRIVCLLGPRWTAGPAGPVVGELVERTVVSGYERI